MLRGMTDSPGMAIRRGVAPDLPAVAALLQRCELPTADLTDAPGLAFWILEASGSLVGAVALEGTGPAARLLRSLVVDPARRRRGLARALVVRAESEAASAGVERLVLLTETAQSFFNRLGYEVIERSAVPELLRESAEFRSLCPATAACMAKRLVPSRG